MTNTSTKKDKHRALLGTVLFHAIIVVCFILFGLSSPLKPDEYGVVVALGYVDQGQGAVQPFASSPPPTQSPPSTPVSEHEDIATQETVESVLIPDDDAEPLAQEELPDADQDDDVADPEETTDEVIVEEPEPVVDPRALFPGRDERSSERQDQGDTTQRGDQGRTEGTIDTDTFEGLGQGEGIEYSLSGRTANFLPVPEYTTQATGRVVVQITVNRQGQVIRAEAGARGTTTTDSTLHRLAEEAARRARFDLKADAPEAQRGTITYNFIRLN